MAERQKNINVRHRISQGRDIQRRVVDENDENDEEYELEYVLIIFQGSKQPQLLRNSC